MSDIKKLTSRYLSDNLGYTGEVSSSGSVIQDIARQYVTNIYKSSPSNPVEFRAKLDSGYFKQKRTAASSSNSNKAGADWAFAQTQSGNAWNPQANQFTFGKTTSADSTGTGYLSVTKASETAAAQTPEYKAAETALGDLGYTPEESKDFLLYNKTTKYNDETNTAIGSDVRNQYISDLYSRLYDESRSEQKTNVYENTATGSKTKTNSSKSHRYAGLGGNSEDTDTTTSLDKTNESTKARTRAFGVTYPGQEETAKKTLEYKNQKAQANAAILQEKDDVNATQYTETATSDNDFETVYKAGRVNTNNKAMQARNGEYEGTQKIYGQSPDFFKNMTEDQFNIYCYYWQKEQNGEIPSGSALNYLKSIQNRVNYSKAQEIVDSANHPVLRELYGLYAGADNFVEGLSALPEMLDNEYVPRANAVQMASQQIRADQNGFSGLTYDLFNTTGNMLPSLLLGGMSGTSWLGTTLMGASAGGNTYSELISQGVDPSTARATAIASGAWEGLSEYYLGAIETLGANRLSKSVAINALENTNKVWKNVAYRLGKAGVDMAQEGAEEIIQDLGESVINGVFQGKWEWSSVEDLLYEGLLGALSAGVLNAPTASVDIYKTSKNININNKISNLGENSAKAFDNFSNNTQSITYTGEPSASATKEWLQLNNKGVEDANNNTESKADDYLNIYAENDGLKYLSKAQAYAAYSSGYNDAVAAYAETKVENTPTPVETQAVNVAPEAEAISAPMQEAVIATENNTPESTQNAPVSSPVYEARQTNIKNTKTLKTAFSEARIANANQSDTFEVVPKKSWSKWNDSVKQSLEDSARTAKAYGKKIEFVNGTINTNDGEYVAIMSDDGKTAYISLNAIKDGKLLDTRKLTSQLFKTKTGITLQAAESEADNGVHLQQSSKRNGSESAAGTTRRVESSTGQTVKNWKTRDGRLNKKLFDGATETTTRELGFKNGTDDMRFKVMPETPESIKEFLDSSMAKDLGINEKDVVCVDGNMSFTDTDGNIISSRGFFDGKNIFVNINSKTTPAEQIIIHEQTHKLIREGKLNPSWIVNKISNKYGEEAFGNIASVYQSAFEGLSLDVAVEEIICDANSYINYFESEDSKLFNKEIANLVNDFQEKIRAEVRNNLRMSSNLGISNRMLTTVANKVVGSFRNSDLGKNYVVGKLDNIYSKLFSENADYDLAYKDALRLADEITQSQFEVVVIDDELDGALRGSKVYVRNSHIHKDDRGKGGVIARLFGHGVYVKSYNAAKDSLIDIKDGRQAIDDLWIELSDRFPQYFDENVSDGDMLEILADVLDTKGSMHHYFASDFSQEDIDLINEERARNIINLLEEHKAKKALSETARDGIAKVKEYEEKSESTPQKFTTDENGYMVIPEDIEDMPFNSRDYVSKQDAEYFSLAKDPEQNADKLQAMVEQAAAQAMPNTKVVGKDGKPKIVYHGTISKNDFNVFNGDIYFFSKEQYADQYTHKRGGLWASPNQVGKVMPCFVNIENPLIIDAKRHLWRNIDVEWSSKPVTTEDIVKYAKENGHDGAIIKRVRDNMSDSDTGYCDEYVAFDSSQVKSAGTTYEIKTRETYPFEDYKSISNETGITYDDNGNVIPLSERFNSKNSDIRFSQTIERGENQVRDIDIPTENINGEKNRRFERTVAESESATDNQAERIKELATYDSLFSYTPIKNTKTANDANIRFNETFGGDIDAAVKGFTDIVNSKRRITAEDIAFGALLIDKLSKIGDTKNYYNVVADMTMLLTEAGQVVQAARILKRITEYSKQFDDSTMAGNIAYRLRGIETAVNKLNKWLDKTFKIGKNKGVQVSISEELKQGLLSAETQEDADYYVDLILKDIADQMPSRFIDKWNAWRYLSMLANPRTHIRNFVGNAIFVPAVMIRNTISGSIQRLNKNASSDRGISQVASKEYRDYAKLVAAEMQGAILGENNKYDERNIILRNKSLFGKSKFGQALNRLSNWNSDKLAREDLIFKNIYFKSALASYLQANKVDLNNVNEEVLQRGIDIAIKDAYKNTYNDVSKVASALSRSKNIKGLGLVVEAVMPFKQVPINILKRGVEYSPLGFVNAISKGIKSYYVDGQFDFNGFADNLASAITGTGFMLLGYLLKNLGVIQGGEPDDDEELEALGYQPYSITIDGVNVTLDWAAPMSMPFFVGATLSELIEEDGLNSNNVTEALTRLPEPMLEMSFLSGLSDLINSVKYADQNFGNANNKTDGGEVSVAVMSQLLYNYLSQGVPTILGQVARTADPVVRRSLIDKTDDSMPDGVKYFIQKLMGKVPLLESTKEPMLTTWGEEKTNDNFLLRAFENFLSPGYISEINNDKVVQSIANTDRKIRETDSEHDSNIPQSRYSISLTTYSYDKASDKYKASNEKKVLTPSEITQYEKSVGNKSYNALNGIMRNSGYDSLSYDMKNRVTEKIFSYVNASVATKEFGTNQLAGDGSVEKGFYKYADSNAYAQFIYEAATISQTNKEETISYNQDVVDAALKKLVSKNIITTSQARKIHASKWSSTKNNPF